MPIETVQSELTRKTLETVERMALRHELGVLSNSQFLTAIEAVWDCTSGLVDDMRDIMADVAEAALVPERDQVVMSNGEIVLIFNRNKAITTVTNARTLEEGSLKAFDTEAEAAEHVRKLVSAAEKKGLKRL